MRPSVALQIYREQIKIIVLAHRASNVRVFGSVIRGEDTDESDLDLLVEPTPETSLMDIGAIRHELKSLLGVNVDVLTPNALPDSFREKVLTESVPV
ncbi:nucleotidyltransferase [Cycloclasticus sp. 46_120_T64]|nr:nucleotidyltransferase [Cycloclasticus sp. 46_120_T64]